jgi:crossover junction endodeoxyribonuclease RuvC
MIDKDGALPCPLPSREGEVARATRATQIARRLRRDSPEAEKRLWRVLRGKQIGAKVRRQQPIEGYVVDLVCFEHRLVIELGGERSA